MKKRINKRSNKKSNRLFQNQQAQTVLSGNFYNICQDFLLKNLEGNFQNIDADQSFAIAVISKEEANHVVTRQAILNLLNYIGSNQSFFINKFIRSKNNLSYSENLNFLKNLNFCNHIHPYLVIIQGFIESTSYIESYFNCLMGKASQYNNLIPKLNANTLPVEVVNNFYELFHKILFNKNRDKLKQFTFFMYKFVKGNASQSILFFMNYFIDDKSDKIFFAHLFLDAKNYSNTSYSTSLAYNTSIAAIDLENFEEAKYWLKKIDDVESSKKIQNRLLEKMKVIEEISTHPLNPKNSSPLQLEDISTTDLIFLCIYLDSCGDDWGLKPLKKYGQYIFPYYITTLITFKSLALKKIIKLLPSAFTTYTLIELNKLEGIIESEKFHININNVPDCKISAIEFLLDEILNRTDKAESCYEIWKKIALDYFHSALEYHLSNLRNSWAKNFKLSEKIILDLSESNLSAKILTYIARNATNYAASQHAKGFTSGNQHTCNTLLSSINRNLEWIESDQFLDKSLVRNRQPILSSERILEIITNITPEDLYNINPNIDSIYTNILI